MSALGKEYFKVKINNVDITESLNVIIDSIRWKDVLNASCESDFSLALPYDSILKPTKGHSVDIYFNDIPKFHGYITSISSSSNPEGINIHCEDEYHILNKNTVEFYVGRQVVDEETVYLTYKLALAALGFPEDIGDFTPQDESYIESGKADTISQIVSKCGTFGWYIQPNGTYKLWTAGYGDIITLNKQILGSNLGLYNVISHSIIEDDTEKIDKLKVILGDTIAVAVDNFYMDICLRTVFEEKADDDSKIYEREYTTNYHWFDGRNLTNEKDIIENKEGWIFTVPAGYWYNYPFSFNPEFLDRVPVYPKPPGIYTVREFAIADENIEQVHEFDAAFWYGGIYPETRHSNIFYIGSGDIEKILNLSNLNHQYGAIYNKVINSGDVNYQITIKHDGEYTIPTFTHQFLEIVIPSWDDTTYATDIATMEYYKYKDTKISGQIQVTFDCIEYYGINLTKRITIDGIYTALNIKSIDYDVNSYLVTINLESENYYKRSVSIPSHTGS